MMVVIIIKRTRWRILMAVLIIPILECIKVLFLKNRVWTLRIIMIHVSEWLLHEVITSNVIIHIISLILPTSTWWILIAEFIAVLSIVLVLEF